MDKGGSKTTGVKESGVTTIISGLSLLTID